MCLHVCKYLKTTSSIIETGSLIGQEFTDSARRPDQQILRISCLYFPCSGIPNMCRHAENFYVLEVKLRSREAHAFLPVPSPQPRQLFSNLFFVWINSWMDEHISK